LSGRHVRPGRTRARASRTGAMMLRASAPT
jgi:hypothetical protein